MVRPGTPLAPAEGRSDVPAIPNDRRLSKDGDPPYLHPAYRSTLLRAPLRTPLRVPFGPTELAGPWLPSLVDDARARIDPNDLTRQHSGPPLGERIIVHGRVLDSGGWPVPGALVEVWQANAAGRYAHLVDQHAAPLDPNFTGAGLCFSDHEGRYRFVTIKPGSYPWANHENAWRPAHIHFSVMGSAFGQRVVTQMYFPGDPLFAYDPIFNAIPTQAAREGLIARFDLAATVPAWALGYQFDIVLGGRGQV